MSSSPALIGLGLTAMSLTPGGDAVSLADEAIAKALEDAHLDLGDVDGLLVNANQGVRQSRLDLHLARDCGFGDLRLLEQLDVKGATAVAMVQHAVLAINAGMAETVVCVFADAPIQAGGSAGSAFAHGGGVDGVRGLERASGVLGAVPSFAMLASRYFSLTGATEDDLCAVACTARAWASGNPAAVARAPLSRDEYFASRMVAAPLRIFDCARPVNGAAAVVVSRADRSAQRPVHVRGMSQAHVMGRRRAPQESWFGGRTAIAVDEALAMANRARADVDVVQLYAPFSVVTLCLLEDYGFFARGAAGGLTRSGATGPGGALPVDTGGGQLAGFYLQGMTPLVEGIIQIRGEGGDRQVVGATTALVSGLGGRMDHHAFVVLDREAT
jgi:acetyl-CoA acetyltransferase